MWYVNFEIQVGSIRHELGFILTMWYVNYFPRYIVAGLYSGFILTMWYVNNLLLNVKVSFLGDLY